MQQRLSLNFNPLSPVGTLPSISALDNVPLPRHRWYFFKEAFSPSLVSHAIDYATVSEKELIIDPFSGSGTVVLESSLKGRTATAYEVNPFLAFVSRTKTLQTTTKTIDKHLIAIEKSIKAGTTSPLEGYSTFSEKDGLKKWLFNRSVLRGFEAAWETTESIHRPAKDIIRLALLGAVMDVCNAAKDGKCLRYKKNWGDSGYNSTDLLASFIDRIQDIKEDLKTTPINQKSSVINGDVRNLSTMYAGERFKLCVTSPPYLNSFDYTDIYRPELFLGKFVKTNIDVQQLRLKTLRSHVQIGWPEPVDMDFGPNFDAAFQEISNKGDNLWNKQIPPMIQAYFEDMKKVLVNLRRNAAEDASVWLVVSTSAYGGVEIPVDTILADIGGRAGWYLRDVHVFRRLKRIAGQQWDSLSEKADGPRLRESIVIFDAAP